jgi:hypothetical protein
MKSAILLHDQLFLLLQIKSEEKREKSYIFYWEEKSVTT